MEEFTLVAFCLFVNALLSAFEMAFVSTPRAELRKLVRKGGAKDATKASQKDGKLAQWLLIRRDTPERTLSVIQIGITLVGALAAALGGAEASENIQPYFMNQLGVSEFISETLSIVLVIVPLTYFSVVFGELIPKSLALKNPLWIVLKGAPWIATVERLLAPVVDVLEKSTRFGLKAISRKVSNPPASLDTTVEIDALTPQHQQYVWNLAKIETKKIRDVMVSWASVNHIQVGNSLEEVMQAVLTSGHTRLPVIDGNVVRGILHTKEFVMLREASRESGDINWQAIIRTAFHVLPTESALSVLRALQERRSHMAIVMGPNSQVDPLGIVTLEDITEEIWGDIFDEDDDGRIRKLFVQRASAKLKPPQAT